MENIENVEVEVTKDAAKKVEINELWPAKCFWAVNLKIIEQMPNGKLKTRREVHLVDGATVGEVETKTKTMMNDSTLEFSIMSIRKSNVTVVY